MRIRSLTPAVALVMLAAPVAASGGHHGYNDGDNGVVAATVTAGDVAVHGACEFRQQGMPNRASVFLVVSGHAYAVAGSGPGPAAVTLRCVLRDDRTGRVVVDARRANEGPIAPLAPPAVVDSAAIAAYTVCVAVEAGDAAIPLVCQPPAS
ncbi:MAG TPA: hypothetical protein VNA20_00350 [Frankiaceae bacterium]|nr:hypothetical protein [Frankiaceae bacterium]